jgi:diguanylate cyclase (GGDEF)-like protein
MALTPASRGWPLGQLRWRPRCYVVAVPVLGAAAAVVAATRTAFSAHQLVTFAALLCCGLASVEATRRVDYSQGGLVRDLLTVWCLPVAILLPPFYALVTPGPLLALTQLRVHRGVIYRRVFSAAAIGLAYGSVSWVFRSLPPATAGHPGWGRHAVVWTLAVAACDLLGWLINNALIVTAIRASDSTARVSELMFSRETALADFVQWNLAVIVTVAAAASPALLVFAVPAVLMQRRFMMHAQLVSKTRIDPKTGLLNVAAWDREATAEITRAVRTHTPLAVALIDIDHFKAVNDTHGHLAGDEVLRTISRILTNSLRSYDLAGRFGGEEFVLLLPHASDADAYRITERLRADIADLPIPISPTPGSPQVKVTVSIGVATLNGARRELADLLAAADAALYYAKETGRNRTRVVTATE